MLIFTLGNAACALAPSYGLLMAARVLTALAHGTFFGVGSVVATGLVAQERRASAIAIMFTGLTVANILGVPFGTWLGQNFGWRATFWAVAVVGLAAVAVLALALPKEKGAVEASDWRADLKAVLQAPVLLGLATTVLGFAGVFAVFTYIAPALTRISGFSESAVSPILLLFGGGLVVGNLIGGRLADRHLLRTVFATLIVLAAVLAAMTVGLQSKVTAVLFVGLLGGAGFATVAPLQMWVLEKAKGVGQSLASSLNIAAFNLGNALGAWAGGAVIDHGPGLGAVPMVAALMPLGRRPDRHRRRPQRPSDEQAGGGGGLRDLTADASPSLFSPTEKEILMDYRRLGNSGLKVPALSFGAATFGGTGPLFGAWGTTDQSEARRLIDICLEAGVTLFDTADVYSNGASERVLAEAVKGRRDALLISTKTTLPLGDGPGDYGSSRSRLIKAVEASLRRLDTDYIDLFHLHAFDAGTPIEEVVSTLDDLIRAGKIRLCRRLQFFRLAGDEIIGDRRRRRLCALCRPFRSIIR